MSAQGVGVIGRLLSLLRLRSAREDEDINVLRRTWREFDIVRDRGAWLAFWIDGTAEPLTGRTAAELSVAIRQAWVAAGRPR